MPEVTDNGGSTILLYDLQVDDGLQSEFLTAYEGLNRTVDITATPGRTYRFRYRVFNVKGWSTLS